MKQLFIPLIAAALISTGLVMLFHKTEPLPVFGKLSSIADFSDQEGKPFTKAQAEGSLTLWSFFFTSCQGPCPDLQGKMGMLQRDLASVSNLKLVSVSIDPDTDSTQALKDYAATIGADPRNWSFVRASADSVKEFAKQSFRAGVDSGEQIHTTRIALSDRDGNVRGQYDVSTPEGLSKLKSDVWRLNSEQPVK